MASYPIRCPHCGLIVDSRDSMLDSREDLRYHIEYKHPEKISKGSRPRVYDTDGDRI